MNNPSVTSNLTTIQTPQVSGNLMSRSVQAARTVASGVNLMEASHQWATRPADQRFQSMAQLSAAVKGRRMRSASRDINLGTIHAREESGTIVINSGISSVEPSHWSFGQLSTWIKAPANYLRTLPQALAVQNINCGIKRFAAEAEKKDLKFMTVMRDDDASGPNTLQAVTSTTYGRIWDADVVDGVQRLLDRSGNKFHNPLAYAAGKMGNATTEPAGLYASDHDVFIFMIDGGSLLEAGPRAQLNRGFIAWNSEVGAKTFGLMTFLFNQCCGNHIIWGASDINKLIIRHTANGPTRFDVEAAPALLAYANESAAPLESAIRKAQEMIILPANTADPIAALKEFAAKHGKFSGSEIRSAYDFAKSEEGDCRTLWQFVQGGTAYARGFDFIDARVDLETRFGKLLDLAKN